jgi:hypothetical protein
VRKFCVIATQLLLQQQFLSDLRCVIAAGSSNHPSRARECVHPAMQPHATDVAKQHWTTVAVTMSDQVKGFRSDVRCVRKNEVD